MAIRILGLFALISCQSAPDAPVCDSELTPTITISTRSPIVPVDDDYIITGTADQPDGLAIREVTVAGVLATSTSYNFRTWSVTLPHDTLVAAAETDASDVGVATLAADAVDACGLHPVAPPSLEVPVDLSGLTPTVSDLTVRVDYPSGADYLPVSPSLEATLVVTAAADSEGATVTLEASGGTVDDTDSTSVTLSGNGTDPAAAYARFSSSEAGTAVVQATAEGAAAVVVIRTIGGPRFDPSSDRLVAGETREVSVMTDGDLASCTTEGAVQLSVVFNGSTISGEVAVDGEEATFSVVAAASITTSEALTLRCEDVHGQEVRGTYSVEP